LKIIVSYDIVSKRADGVVKFMIKRLSLNVVTSLSVVKTKYVFLVKILMIIISVNCYFRHRLSITGCLTCSITCSSWLQTALTSLRNWRLFTHEWLLAKNFQFANYRQTDDFKKMPLNPNGKRWKRLYVGLVLQRRLRVTIVHNAWQSWLNVGQKNRWS